MNKILIQQQDFNLNAEVLLLRKSANNIGAVVSFVGIVRELDNEVMQKMTLEHYPKMTKKALESIANQAHKRWQLNGITIIHRVGDLNVKDQIVLVITASKHRKSAFESCEFIMDYLKIQAPFWKKEYSENGEKWVESKADDTAQINKWKSL